MNKVVSKKYQEIPKARENKLNLYVSKLKTDDYVNKMETKQNFITLKNQQANFKNKSEGNLLNPTKYQIARLSMYLPNPFATERMRRNIKQI